MQFLQKPIMKTQVVDEINHKARSCAENTCMHLRVENKKPRITVHIRDIIVLIKVKFIKISI